MAVVDKKAVRLAADLLDDANAMLERLEATQEELRAMVERTTRMRAYFEDVLDAAEAEEALAEVKEQGTIPLDQLERELGL